MVKMASGKKISLLITKKQKISQFLYRKEGRLIMYNYFDLVKPTYVENWPAQLYNYSVATIHFPISGEQMQTLINCNYMTVEDGHNPTEKEKTILKEIEAILDSYIIQFPKGSFVRLGSRSPKDSYDAHKKLFRYYNGHEAIAALCDSERIHDDLYLAKANNYTPSLVVREWININPWQEFRAFYKNRKLIGLSQYNYLQQEVFPEILELANTIEWAIRVKSEIVATLLPLDNVVVDYIYKVRNYGNERVSEVILLEVNPFMVYTDPCLFNWSRDNFQTFEFRYNN